MTTASRISVIGAALLLVVLIVTTVSGQRVECQAVVEFRGRVDSAVASAETRAAAERQARETACGTISSGMNDRIACAATPPASLACRDL